MKGELLCLLLCFVGVLSLTRKQQYVEHNRRRIASTTEPHTPEPPPQDEEVEYEQLSEECPQLDGFFGHPEYCDKYYHCQDGKPIEKDCPDGMVFDERNGQSSIEKCELPFSVDCSKRPKLQPPKPSPNCPRMHGYFAHTDKRICDIFYYCVEGKFNMITCPDGLVFSEKTGICNWADEVQKKGCGSRELFNFTCPVVDPSVAATHPRYPDDCRYFYVCVNGEIPRRSGCKLGQAFDHRTGKCDWARKIPECKDYYKGTLTDKELDELENPPPRPKTTGGSNRRKIHKQEED